MRTLVFLCFSFFFMGCEKDIDIVLNQSSDKLVVDATIENDRPPMVFLSKSLDYFSKIDANKISSSFVKNAVVRISDGSRQVTLALDSLKNREGVSIYFYTPSGLSNLMVGKLNATYTLTIESEGKSYSASTTIPGLTRRIDSLWWEKLPFEGDTPKVRMMIKATDRPGLGDYIRYFTRVGQAPFLPGFNSVFDDQIIDGSTYTIAIDKGFDRNGQFSDNSSYFDKGDTVTLKLCNIDKQTYDFWRTLEFSFQSIGNPFSSPTRILSNVSGEALGYFGGYAAQYRTIIIPK